ncbi:MAG TPA: ferritin-like domain-containing protein [Burkholderiales bacterium]|nr:ferritin-like domain-containing protein [Burkholderiales bacterium]
MRDLFITAHAALSECDAERKCEMAAALKVDWDAGRFVCATSTTPIDSLDEPGRPPHPLLVSPREVENRSLATAEGRAALIHAIAHIEFNAVNLALDAVYRFRDLPREYYGDWLTVAAEEAYHFTLLRDHLRTLDYDYGRFSAHNGLWEMAQKTAHDPLVRMALVPRVLEARGLDVSPALIAKLESGGDARAVEILQIIFRDEIGHVRIGNRWYRHVCQQRGVDPIETFRRLLQEYGSMRLRRPFHNSARRAAGFTEDELRLIEELAAGV